MGCGSSSASKEPALSLNFGTLPRSPLVAKIQTANLSLLGESPAGADGDVARELRENLQQADNILQQLKTFKGCGDLVREVRPLSPVTKCAD